MANVTLGGNPITVNGTFPKPGDTVQDFTLTGQDLKDVSLKDYAGKRKVPRYPLNCLRHLFASIRIDLNANAKELSREMGHASVAFTLATYAKLFADRQKFAGLPRRFRNLGEGLKLALRFFETPGTIKVGSIAGSDVLPWNGTYMSKT